MARNFPNFVGNRLRLNSDVTVLKFMENDHSWSMHVWVRLTSTAGDQTILSKYPGTGSRGFLLRVNATKLGAFYIDTGSSGREPLSTTSFTANAWTSCGCTFDTATSALLVYFNGVQEGSVSGFQIATNMTANWRGGVRANDVSPLNGDLAEITFWDNTVLAAAEMLALAKGVPPRKIRPSGIIARWPVYGVGSPEPDYSGNANHFVVDSTTLANHAPVGR